MGIKHRMKKPPADFAEAINQGVIASQREYLRACQTKLGYGPTEMAKMLGTNFNTYKAWLYGNNPMPNVARVALDCIIRNWPDHQNG